MGCRALGGVFAALLLAGCGDSVAAPANQPSPSQGSLNAWTPQVAIVFPVANAEGSKNPPESYAVNVSVWPANRVLCDQPPKPAVSLFMAKALNPVELVDKQPEMMRRKEGSTSFPSQEYNQVPANLVADSNTSYTFVAYVRGQPASNVWLYGKPPGQYAPVKPTGYASPDPAALDTRIQVVFPHDSQGRQVPPAQATALNIAVDVFQHGTELSVPPDSTIEPRLWQAEGSSLLKAAPPGVQKTTYTLNGQGYPRWVFNDVQVHPGQAYHFLATVGQLGQHGGAYPTIWTHGTAAKGAPKIETPPGCIP